MDRRARDTLLRTLRESHAVESSGIWKNENAYALLIGEFPGLGERIAHIEAGLAIAPAPFSSREQHSAPRTGKQRRHSEEDEHDDAKRIRIGSSKDTQV